MVKPLEGLLVLDFSQFLAGPSAALRLADLGARVIKIERPEGGDLSRQIFLGGFSFDGESSVFHAINRHKESFAANLKDPADQGRVKKLIGKADVLIESFRPGVMAKLGLDYEVARAINPEIVYASVSGYGTRGPWRNKPGQDLLAQSMSGLTWLNGNADQPPLPFALSVADMYAGVHLVQGILACLVRRSITKKGGLVEVSLMESILDMQFEALTVFLNDDGKPPQRSALSSAHPYVAAPYGIYATADGYLALAMGSVPRLGELLGCPELARFADPQTWFAERDEIKTILTGRLPSRSTADWLAILEPAGVWCADVLTWQELMKQEGFKALDMIQEVAGNGVQFRTTRCPIRIDGEILKDAAGAPSIGENTQSLSREFML